MCVALMEDKETSQLFTDTRYAYSIYGRLVHSYLPHGDYTKMGWLVEL